MKTLSLSDALSLPLEVVTEKLAWIGVTGSGKSYGASKLAELLWAQHAQFVVLDPVGTWFGLRLAADGKGAGLPVPVFGGLHGDVPLEPTGGALVADLLVDRDLSAVLDVSQFESDAQKARFVSDFAERFFARKKAVPSAVHLFLEEAQEFVPQNPQRGEELMLHRLHRLQKLGRNFGIGTSIITQRPQETSKKALNQAQTVFAFRLTGSQERKAVELWIADKGLDQDLVARLPKLETGSCHVWSPAWLKVSKVVRVAAKRTYDASATPKVGEARAARELAPIDLERIRAAMAATIEKAKADDPKALRAKLAELQKKLYGAETKQLVAAPAPKAERVEVPVLKEGQLKRLEGALERARKVQEASLEAMLAVTTVLDRYQATPAPMSSVRKIARDWKQGLVNLSVEAANQTKLPLVAETPGPRGTTAAFGLSTPQARVLAALVFLEGVGVDAPDKYQVALFVGVAPTSGSYANNLGALRSAGLVDYPAPGALALTEAGRRSAPPVRVPSNTAELHAAVLAKLSGPQAKVLECLLRAYPEKLLKTELADAVGVSPTSGSFANNLGFLRTMGAVTYPKKGEVRAADLLFIP